MHRLTIIVAVLLLAGGIAIFKLATYDPSADETMPDMTGIITWEPTTAQIRGELNAQMPELERKQQYARLFRTRYRSKDIPVNLRVDSQGNFLLECAAVIPIWDKALIAHHTWREVRELFGESPHIIIYESYIGTSSRRVGEARADEPTTNAPSVVFDTGWHLRREVQATDFLR